MGPLTQEDPIGIAGGLNLYGFANGDPINFSDPFGLEAEDDGGAAAEDEPDPCKRLRSAAQRAKCRERMDALTDEDLEISSELKQCLAATAELASRAALDIGLLYTGGLGLQAVGRGAILMAEGAAISSGLILTTTSGTAGTLGGMELLGGRAMVTGGVATVTAPRTVGMSLLPTNALSFFPSRQSACGR